MEQLRVELVHRTVPADDHTRASRENTVRRLAALGQIEDPSAGQIGDTVTTWSARINGAEFPIVGYLASPDEVSGEMLVSLTLAPSSLSIGDPATAVQPTQLRTADERPPRLSWGTPGQPDPRERIAGWKPESLGEQVAGNAASQFGPVTA